MINSAVDCAEEGRPRGFMDLSPRKESDPRLTLDSVSLCLAVSRLHAFSKLLPWLTWANCTLHRCYSVARTASCGCGGMCIRWLCFQSIAESIADPSSDRKRHDWSVAMRL